MCCLFPVLRFLLQSFLWSRPPPPSGKDNPSPEGCFWWSFKRIKFFSTTIPGRGISCLRFPLSEFRVFSSVTLQKEPKKASAFTPSPLFCDAAPFGGSSGGPIHEAGFIPEPSRNWISFVFRVGISRSSTIFFFFFLLFAALLARALLSPLGEISFFFLSIRGKHWPLRLLRCKGVRQLATRSAPRFREVEILLPRVQYFFFFSFPVDKPFPLIWGPSGPFLFRN